MDVSRCTRPVHAENLAGIVIAEYLAEFILLIRHSIPGHQLDKTPLGV